MDDRRFDDLTKLLFAVPSRRGVVRVLLAGMLGGLGGGLPAAVPIPHASAAKRGKKRHQGSKERSGDGDRDPDQHRPERRSDRPAHDDLVAEKKKKGKKKKAKKKRGCPAGTVAQGGQCMPCPTCVCPRCDFACQTCDHYDASCRTGCNGAACASVAATCAASVKSGDHQKLARHLADQGYVAGAPEAGVLVEGDGAVRGTVIGTPYTAAGLPGRAAATLYFMQDPGTSGVAAAIVRPEADDPYALYVDDDGTVSTLTSTPVAETRSAGVRASAARLVEQSPQDCERCLNWLGSGAGYVICAPVAGAAGFACGGLASPTLFGIPIAAAACLIGAEVSCGATAGPKAGRTLCDWACPEPTECEKANLHCNDYCQTCDLSDTGVYHCVDKPEKGGCQVCVPHRDVWRFEGGCDEGYYCLEDTDGQDRCTTQCNDQDECPFGYQCHFGRCRPSGEDGPCAGTDCKGACDVCDPADGVCKRSCHLPDAGSLDGCRGICNACPECLGCCAGTCCPRGEACCGEACCDTATHACCGDTCCDKDTQVCCGATCCDKDTQECCGDRCCDKLPDGLWVGTMAHSFRREQRNWGTRECGEWSGHVITLYTTTFDLRANGAIQVTAEASYDQANYAYCPGGDPPNFCHYGLDTRTEWMAPFDRVLAGEEVQRSPVQGEPGGRVEWDGHGAFDPPQQAWSGELTYACPPPGTETYTYHDQNPAWPDFRLDLGTPEWQDGEWTLSGSDPGASSFEESEGGWVRVTERFTWNLTLQPRTVA